MITKETYEEAKEVMQEIRNAYNYYDHHGIGGKWTAELFEEALQKAREFIANVFGFEDML